MHKPYAVEMRKRAKVVKIIKDNIYLNEIVDFCWKEINRLANKGYVSMSFVIENRDIYGRTVEFAELKLRLEIEFQEKGYTIEVIQKQNLDILIGICW